MLIHLFIWVISSLELLLRYVLCTYLLADIYWEVKLLGCQYSHVQLWEHIAIFQNSHCNHVLSYQQQRIPPASHPHQLMVWPVLLFTMSSFLPHHKRSIVLFCPLVGHVNFGDWWVQYLPWSLTLNSVVSLYN